jgi:hypothetical protein
MNSTTGAVVPWSTVQNLGLSRKRIAVLKRLDAYNLGHITNNLINKGRRFSPEQVWPIQNHFGKADLDVAQLLEREFKRFVALTVMYPENVYAPSGPVDMYWHFFILHTRDYANFCGAIWSASPDHGDEQARSRLPEKETLLNKPISIVPEWSLGGQSEEVLQALRMLEWYELSRITSELVDVGRKFAPEQIWPIKAHFGKADKSVAVALEGEFKRFVALTLLNPNITFAPSGPVDMYWHFLILHTKEYREFCDAVWGQFQHHPRGSNAEMESDILPLHLKHDTYNHAVPGAFEATIDCYYKTFGRADELVWHSPTIELRINNGYTNMLKVL